MLWDIMKWWKEFHCLQWFSEKLHHIVKTLWLVDKKKNQCLVLVNDNSVDTYAVHTSTPSNISTDDVGVSFVEIVEEKRQVRWVILTLTYLLLRRAISGKGVRTLSGSTCLNGVDLPNKFFSLSNEILNDY